VDSYVVCKDRSGLQQRRFELLAFELEVEDEFEELEELVEDFVNGCLYAVGGELEFYP
jgi:hypothetical protein